MARRTAPRISRAHLLTTTSGLATHVPLAAVEAALAMHRKEGARDRLLPAPLVVYFVIALALYQPAPLREVLRALLAGLRPLGRAPHAPLPVATKSSLSRARTRLGPEVLTTLCATLLRPLATPQTRGAWYRGARLVAVDGTTLAVPDTAPNREAFGLHGASACPLVRLVALVEVGTHAILRAAWAASATAELTLAERLLPTLTPQMLLLDDRGFVGSPWWHAVQATGAAHLGRVRSNQHFPVLDVLSDGSFLSVLRSPAGGDGPPLPVRIIDYTLAGVPGAEPHSRLCTTLLDPAAAPAAELAALYHERWEAESVFDEVKTHLRGGAYVVLRSKTPALVAQEVAGVLLAHFVVRAVLPDAALQIAEDPDRLSFTHAVRVVRRRLPEVAGGFSPSAPAPLVPGRA